MLTLTYSRTYSYNFRIKIPTSFEFNVPKFQKKKFGPSYKLSYIFQHFKKKNICPKLVQF